MNEEKLTNLCYKIEKISMPISTLLGIKEESLGKKYATATLFDGLGGMSVGKGIELLGEKIPEISGHLINSLENYSPYLASYFSDLTKQVPANIPQYISDTGEILFLCGATLFLVNAASSIIYRNR